MRGAKKVIFNLLAIFLIAGGLAFLAVFRYYCHNGADTIRIIAENPRGFLGLFALFSFFVMFFYGVTRRLFIGAGALSVILLWLTQIHVDKMLAGAGALKLSDFADFNNIINIVRGGGVVELVWILAVVVIVFGIFWSLDRAGGERWRISGETSAVEIIIDGKARPGKFRQWLRRRAISQRLTLMILSGGGAVLFLLYFKDFLGFLL